MPFVAQSCRKADFEWQFYTTVFFSESNFTPATFTFSVAKFFEVAYRLRDYNWDGFLSIKCRFWYSLEGRFGHSHKISGDSGLFHSISESKHDCIKEMVISGVCYRKAFRWKDRTHLSHWNCLGTMIMIPLARKRQGYQSSSYWVRTDVVHRSSRSPKNQSDPTTCRPGSFSVLLPNCLRLSSHLSIITSLDSSIFYPHTISDGESAVTQIKRALIMSVQSRMYYYSIHCLTGLGKASMGIGGPCVISKLQMLARQQTPCHIVTDAERAFRYHAFRFVHIHSRSANRCMQRVESNAGHLWTTRATLPIRLPLYSFLKRRLDASVSGSTQAVARMSKEGLPYIGATSIRYEVSFVDRLQLER